MTEMGQEIPHTEKTKKSQLTTRKTQLKTRNGPKIPKPQDDYKSQPITQK